MRLERTPSTNIRRCTMHLLPRPIFSPHNFRRLPKCCNITTVCRALSSHTGFMYTYVIWVTDAIIQITYPATDHMLIPSVIGLLIYFFLEPALLIGNKP